MKQSETRNLTMMMDLYEMTMANGYFNDQDKDTRVAFDVFYRSNPDGGGFAIFAGLEQILEYIENLHFDEEDIAYFRSLNIFTEDFLAYLKDFKFSGDIYAFKEGTIMYPNEPIITVVAPLIDAQLIETALLAQVNHQSLIATKTRRIVSAAEGRAVSDFGARRAHNMDAAVYGARAAYIGGAVGTATVLAGQMFDIPVSGTMAHSWVMYYKDEFEAFKHYAENYPDGTVLLVDTYDVIGSGIPNAIRVAKEVLEPMGKRLKGIRIDSGDLAYLSKEAYKMLAAAGFDDATISASSDLDEYLIESLKAQDAKINSWGVGTNLITSKDCPSFGGVYKLVAVKQPDGSYTPKMKCSDSASKAIIPGKKMPWRLYDENGQAQCDLIAMDDEVIEAGKPVTMVNLDSDAIERTVTITPTKVKKLLVPHVLNGQLAIELPSIAEKKAYIAKQLTEETWESELRLECPHKHYVNMTPAVAECRSKMYAELHGGKV